MHLDCGRAGVTLNPGVPLCHRSSGDRSCPARIIIWIGWPGAPHAISGPSGLNWPHKQKPPEFAPPRVSPLRPMVAVRMAATPMVPDEDLDGQEPRRMRVVGYLRGPAPDGMDCESPLLAVSDSDPADREVWRCSNHRQSKCRPCAARYRRRVQSVASEGMYRASGFYYLLTLTAPGDHEHFLPSGKRCSCTPSGGVDLARWNAGAGRLWNRMLLSIERRYGVRPSYFRAAETQDRGALHHHILLWSPRKFALRTLRQMAIAAGYGHEVDLQVLTPGSKAAADYVTKRVSGYVTKSCDGRDDVPWWASFVDEETGEVCEGQCRATFRTWSQSKSWGRSMVAIRTVARRKYLEGQRAVADSPSTDGLNANADPAESPPSPA